MTRPLRIQFPGAIYHITVRGNAYQKIFLDKHDYLLFLETLVEVKEYCGWEIFAYSLMPNHFHLLLKTPEPNLSIGMRELNGNYTLRFNARHKRVGHLFQGRYKSIIVDGDNYLYELIRYIVLNPVKAKLVKDPKNWPWSSHREMMSQKKNNIIIKKAKVLSFFGSDKREAKKEYLTYINEKQDNDIWGDLKGSLILGSDEFADKINNLLNDPKYNSKEYTNKQRNFNRPRLNVLLKDNKDNKKLNSMIYKARKFGYTNYEISKYLGVHYTTISKIYNSYKRKINRS